MSTPTLSVVVPNYNHARFLPESLGAILAQSYRPTEIIVIDDASKDNSLDVLARIAAANPGRLHVIRNERNQGVVHNVRRMLDMARGDYVYAAASDDMLLPGFFERSIRLLARNPTAGFCSTLSAIMNETGEYEGLVRHPVVRSSDAFLSPAEVLIELRRQPAWFMPSTNVYRREALLAAGSFLEELGPYSDGFVSLVLGLKHGACFIPEPLGVWRRMSGTYSTALGRDLQPTLTILRNAERLMRSTYADLFPAEYIDEWKSETYFGTASAYARNCPDARLTGLEQLLPNRTAIDDVFLRAMRTWPALRRIAKPYLFLRMRPKHIAETIRRQCLYAAHPRFRRQMNLSAPHDLNPRAQTRLSSM